MGPLHTGQAFTAAAHAWHIDMWPQGSMAISCGLAIHTTHHGLLRRCRLPSPDVSTEEPSSSEQNDTEAPADSGGGSEAEGRHTARPCCPAADPAAGPVASAGLFGAYPQTAAAKAAPAIHLVPSVGTQANATRPAEAVACTKVQALSIGAAGLAVGPGLVSLRRGALRAAATPSLLVAGSSGEKTAAGLPRSDSVEVGPGTAQQRGGSSACNLLCDGSIKPWHCGLGQLLSLMVLTRELEEVPEGVRFRGEGAARKGGKVSAQTHAKRGICELKMRPHGWQCRQEAFTWQLTQKRLLQFL
eukprot:CAMPEP_0171082280 /NCGR_PEP_ID=MMETSP0766_2-20121228/17005_1 /TAXON_ID=439317 /ORGANISM="Gambierdiscus australes, Strain CAWD 149" /LENGTH=300 /DNA_ID=CAMNT_0011539635 /DNA_START=265 /DNA_END=1169 /DNA_ORIENTATION=-